ncbi:FAD/NAD(P)-binding domain-containing protein [Westerdykella ornata]|uniref:FAD/NAD(P)-binding domain-containing protein n=1 Tax=Westerdykella ornata TaxID=318751 RepID=A0A6A6JSU2_WESOR|nr:FAD/NAD(P)-binding domain-containing protein [Westerdykella ornata]KAF2279457.1 FAD/NAD(P)-binding domain-containing protein [Westerdykella ornata]
MPQPPRPSIVDCLIIGAGPAGLTSALAFARTLSTALVFDSSSYRNEGIAHMHTVPSRDHIDPYEFRAISRSQITSRYATVWFEDATVVQARKKFLTLKSAHLGSREREYDGFEVEDSTGKTYQGRKLILATGSQDVLPGIPGYAENWPSHIYQCLACDGFELRGRPIGILEFKSPMAQHFVFMAKNFSSSVTIFANGEVEKENEAVKKALSVCKQWGVGLDERKITRMIRHGGGDDAPGGITLEFETGGPVTLGFLVHKPPTVNRAGDLIMQLGVETAPAQMGGNVVVKDMFNETSVRGVFAAGDTMTPLKQVTVAMAEGLKAAAGVGKQIGEEEALEALRALEGAEGE